MTSRHGNLGATPHAGMRWAQRWACLLAGVLGLLPATAGTTGGREYFVRSDGHDDAAGTSPAAAWHSIDRVNNAQLSPGDQVWFEGGQSFPGNLHLTASDAGSPEAPVVIGSRGPGRAELLAGNGNGITVENAANVRLENLVVHGAGRTHNTGYGVLCDNLRTNGPRLTNLVIQGLEVAGFGVQGILISGMRAGWEQVRVRDCALHDNLRGGMEVAGRLPYDTAEYAHADVVVERCRAYDNTGDPNYARNHSGSGIVLYQVDGGVMRRCTAWNNGALGDNRAGGGVGLWVCAARRVAIEECESFGNRTRGLDGGGFDLDGGCEECLLQYNYSHDNDGPGLMVYTYPYASHHDRANIVRFNVSANDARRGRRYAGLWVQADGRTMSGLEIYNNTVVMAAGGAQAAFVRATGVEARLRNNLFLAAGETVPLRVQDPTPGVRCEGNFYWRGGAAFDLPWGDAHYKSLAEFRAATGQESALPGGSGAAQDPLLTPLPPGLAPAQEVGLEKLTAYTPLPDSPVLAGGLDLAAAGFPAAPRDLRGRALPAHNRLAGAMLGPVVKN